MKRKTKFILLSCILGLIFGFVIISLNHKEDDIDTKKEKVVEAEDIGIKEIEDNETEDSKEEIVKEEKIEKEESTESTSNDTKKEEVASEKEVEKKEEPKVENIEEEANEEKEESNLVSLGKFKLTAYCSCSKCCGEWSGSPTASGVMPKANRTIAVDTSVIPFGTKVMINGNTYVAEDTGGAIKGNKIDVFFDSHSKALNFGVQYAEVFVVK